LKIDNKQREAIARRMGYSGPMNKFAEFLMSSPNPRKMAEGGLVEDTTKTKDSSITEVNKIANKIDDVTPAGIPNVEVTPLVATSNQFIPTTSGQLTTPAPVADFTAATTTTVADPTAVNAQTVDTALTQPGVENMVNTFDGPAVGSVNESSTVQGQLSGLMDDFEGGATPAWAAGALRNATGQMNARGLGASSMAAGASVQAAMEAALPIAFADAQTHATMALANLNNEQQVLMQKNVARAESFFTDAAAENATRQFNASSQMQTDQFNTSLLSQVKQFNAAQVNATSQFNAGQKNALSQFNATMKNNREQFNSANRLIVDQANATWRQQIATVNNANINEANRTEAQMLFDRNLSEMNNLFQERRDLISFVYDSKQSEKDRGLSILLAQMSADEAERYQDKASSDAMWATAGALLAEFTDGIDVTEWF